MLLLLLTLPACKDDDPEKPSNLDPSSTPTSTERALDSTDQTTDTAEPAESAPRPIAIGDRRRDTIDLPDVDADIPYETDWYVLDGEAGEAVTFRVEATEESRLRPMIRVLIPGSGAREEWEQVGARRAADDEPAVTLTVEWEASGARLVAVDDARNVVDGGDTSTSTVGGESFGYILTVEPRGD